MESAHYKCCNCAASYALDEIIYQCACGGLLGFSDDVQFDERAVEKTEFSLLRYRALLPPALVRHIQRITLGEGWTNIVHFSSDDRHLLVKMDHLMPTMSFKDRGAILVVAAAMEAQAQRIVQDSSGNAGHAVATYAARAGIDCDIYLPGSTSPKKLEMIAATGAMPRLISGSREQTAQATLEAANEPGTFYASHVYNPLFYEGTKTYLFEVFEQLQRLPENLIVPVGNGTLLLGVIRALAQLRSSISGSAPRIIAVQAARCAPIHAAFESGQQEAAPVANLGTVAEGIAIAAPMRSAQILRGLRSVDGSVVVVDEEAIANAHRITANQGLHVELTSAANFAAAKSIQKSLQGEILLPACGAGLKSA